MQNAAGLTGETSRPGIQGSEERSVADAVPDGSAGAGTGQVEKISDAAALDAMRMMGLGSDKEMTSGESDAGEPQTDVGTAAIGELSSSSDRSRTASTNQPLRADLHPNPEPRNPSPDSPPETRTPRPERRFRSPRSREHRRLRIRRHGRRAYIRSVYFLPSMATLGNAICGFAAMYVAAFDTSNVGHDTLAQYFVGVRFLAAAYLIFFAMLFDALDGRLARLTRHTTDFGGQLDSLADVISFGAAPAFIALLVFKSDGPSNMPFTLTRLIWAIGALYFSCAAIRLARFNVSNEHGEQHHFSFLGLPSPGAAGAVAALVLMEQDLRNMGHSVTRHLANICVYVLPLVVLCTGLLMVSTIRYSHVVNRWLRGRKPIARLMAGVIILLLLIVAHRFVLGVGCLAYAFYGPGTYLYLRSRRKTTAA